MFCSSVTAIRVLLVSVAGMEPTFDVPIVNVTVVRGQIALLPCSIDFLGKFKVRLHTLPYFFTHYSTYLLLFNLAFVLFE